MKFLKIDRCQAQKYLDKVGITGANINGFLYANPDVDQIFSNENFSGLLVCDGDTTLLHSNDQEFLSNAYDFVPDTAFFSCVEYSSSLYLQKTKGAVINSYCHILAYLKDSPPSDLPLAPTGLTLKSIDLKDLDVINDYYTYKSPTSRERLEKEISSRDSSALYDGDKILAWNLLHKDYAMGVMFVPPEQRGKGYAQIVAGDLLKKVLAKGKLPYVQIVDGNIASLSLATKLGFEKVFEACWLKKHA